MSWTTLLMSKLSSLCLRQIRVYRSAMCQSKTNLRPRKSQTGMYLSNKRQSKLMKKSTRFLRSQVVKVSATARKTSRMKHWTIKVAKTIWLQKIRTPWKTRAPSLLKTRLTFSRMTLSDKRTRPAHLRLRSNLRRKSSKRNYPMPMMVSNSNSAKHSNILIKLQKTSRLIRLSIRQIRWIS